MAAFALYAICLIALVFVFPHISALLMAITGAVLGLLLCAFTVHRNSRAQTDLNRRLSDLQEHYAKANQALDEAGQRAREAERAAMTPAAAPDAPVLDEASTQWEAAFDSLPDGAFLFDAGGHLKRINAAGAVLEKEACGTLEFGGKRCCEMFWRVAGATECVVERARTRGETVEVEMLAGHDQPTLLAVIPVRGAGGEFNGDILVAARDVSALRRAETEAFEHKSFMASLADLTPDEIYTLDAAGCLTWVNERARTESGLSDSALLGRHFSEIVSAESRESATLSLRRAQMGDDAQCEVKMLRADATVRDVDAHTSPLWRDGEVTGALVFLRDVTERKRTQEQFAQSDKLRALGELAAGVAHNLNNSLTVIQGRAQLLLMRGKHDEATARNLEVITNAVGDSAQTLKRMLDFARRDAAHDLAPVELAELITSSVEIARPKWQNEAAAQARSINVRVENQAGVYVLGQAAELREVVLNLLFNAVDAMPAGGVIETGARAEFDSACFWVADTGSGMDAETQAHIFEPFYSTKGERGTGLGLSASHGIISRHGGQIMVVSEPGEGTRIEIRLPLYEKPRETKTAANTVMPVQSRRARVLVVDDEENIRALLRDAFEAAGHTVSEAATGTEALARLDDMRIDLVVCDLGLPEISGLHVARWVKEHKPETFFILATGWADMVTPEDYEQGRIDAVIKKPFALTEILERATELLNGNAAPETVPFELII
ncbi:MAG: ATP-binding protein [Pyrinomonadaceae bacterium]